MPKISVSLPEEILDFVNKQGKNRSKMIVAILKKYKQLKEEEILANAYKQYEELREKDDPDWESTALKDLRLE